MLKFSTQLQQIQKSIIIMKIMETIEIDSPTGSLRPALLFFFTCVYAASKPEWNQRFCMESHCIQVHMGREDMSLLYNIIRVYDSHFQIKPVVLLITT